MRASKNLWQVRALSPWVLVIALLAISSFAHAQVQGQVVAESVPTNSTPRPNEVITVAINIDMRGVQTPDNRLNSYFAGLAWNPTVIKFTGMTPAPAPWNNPSIDTANAVNGSLGWNDFRAGGVDPAKINVLNLNFKVIGAPGSSTVLDLSFSAMNNSLFRSLLGNLTINDGTVEVQGGIEPPQCNVKITTPHTGTNICTDSVEVVGIIAVTGGVSPFNVACKVNGIPAAVSGSTFRVTVPLALGENSLVATSTVTDSQGQQTVCSDIITVVRAAPLACDVKITTPVAGQVVCANSVPVKGTHSITGGVPPYAVTCSVNGVAATLLGDTFTATVTLPAGVQVIVATCTVVDSCGQQTTCADTVRVMPSPPLACNLHITSPLEGTFVCGDSVMVTGTTTVSGGLAPLSSTCVVNGVPAQVVGNTFTATIVLGPGAESIIAVCSVSDSCGSQTVCQDSVQVKRPAPLVCEIQITSPLTGAFICGDSVTVTGTTTITGGLAPLEEACMVNGIPVEVIGNEFTATIALEPGVLFIVAHCTITDSCGSESACQDTIGIERPDPPVCEVQITSPASGGFVCGDSVTVHGVHTVTGGVPPLSTACSVNGVPAIVVGNTFTTTIPLTPSTEFIIATCTVTDSCRSQSTCIDSVRIQQSSTQTACSVQITSPQNGAIVCDDTLTVTGSMTIATGTGGSPLVTSKVNGESATIAGGLLSAQVPLTSGNNLIVVASTVVDSCGNTALCRDSVTVFLDDIHPSCDFIDRGTFATGTFTDNESGIAFIRPVKLQNATLTVDPSFRRGDKIVNFRIDAIDPNQPKGFRINVTDMCGNTFSCDPVLLTLSTDNGPAEFDFTFPHEDHYLQVANHGLSEIHMVLNGNRFALFSDVQLARQAFNAFVMPVDGTVTIDLHPYLFEGENDLSITFAGDPGSMASFMLVDMTTNHVDYVLELQPLPATFSLGQNYPNPFNPTTNIRFDIPQTMAEGVAVQLRVYNLMGEVVRSFSEETKLPGRYLVQWDGRNDNGEMVATGIYVYQLIAGSFRETKRMTLVK